MFRIAICDDSPQWLRKIEILARAFFQNIKANCRLDVYQSGENLLQNIATPYDIALLDVNLQSTNGIEVASQLRITNPQIVLIFVSEYVEYAPFGYEVDAIRYLLKNRLEQAFDRVMNEAVKKVQEKHRRYAIATDAGYVMVKFEDILYIEGQKRKVTYHLQHNDRASYECNESLSDVEARLGTQGFLKTYRTILVNMRHICFLNRTHLILTDGTDLPISKQNSKEIMQTYTLWVGAL
ncbi:MAG: LytTR family DNA-binding domain-containing protein [Gemmiger sp.]|uniref:LytR/AlgR family response regulator transcription factor n=1 Tax=Gemmiger sp. TaxID=2049027 RepID=UPI002E76FCDA|nr:LytTR family DNA-binding domain-containing protein [Gemmiger sp.]MEE0708935.1 LytTR family DNA-binding domain-containing protein [Gemmiger sp.]